ncbi:pentapeptide repeat-containing protein [Tritonibacter scottomollicae]|uniref:pentapeptide repeat-containing protein n=1 Tax=Tritonibacter scottomollicae TaxID=483013 RepID=UPI003AA93223
MPDSADTRPPEVPEGLRAANENPWYILMTLYGEQENEQKFDSELHQRNRWAWNSWAGKNLSLSEHKSAPDISKELMTWSDRGSDIIEKFQQECGLRGFRGALPDPQRSISLRNLHFVNYLCLQGFVFPSEVISEGAYFSSGSSFRQANFLRGVKFDNASFSTVSTFRGAQFQRKVSFKQATFNDNATFTRAHFVGDVTFYNANFAGAVNMVSVHFDRNVKFVKSSFQGDADFSGCVCEGEFNLSKAHLVSSVSFLKSRFLSPVKFVSAKFQGFTYFTESSFAGKEHACIPNFSNCQFEKPTSFRQALFRDGYPDFSGAVLHDKTSFTARMEPTSDEIAEDGTLKGRTFWPRKTKQDPVRARESCATIRHVLAQQGLPEEAHFFFRREMYFAGRPSEDCAGLPSKKRSKGRSFSERLPYLLFGWLSDFGYSIQRPLVWLLCLWAFGGAAFWGYLASCCVPAPPGVVERPMGTAMALSFSNLFPLFGFGRGALGEILDKMPPVLQVLSGAQTVLSLPLLFFLGLALRQRFRLR